MRKWHIPKLLENNHNKSIKFNKLTKFKMLLLQLSFSTLTKKKKKIAKYNT